MKTVTRTGTAAVLCLLAGAVILCTCIPVRHNINPVYKDYSFTGRRLIVYPAPLKRVRMNCPDEIRRSYKSAAAKTPEAVINDAFYLALQGYLRQHAKGIEVAGLGARRNALPALYGTDNARVITLEYDKKHIDDFQVATDAFMTKNGIRPDVVLYLNRLDFMQMMQQRSDPNVTGNELYLSLLIRYILWDHKGGAAISYGEIEVNEAVEQEVTAKTWQALFEKAGRKILYQSPIK